MLKISIIPLQSSLWHLYRLIYNLTIIRCDIIFINSVERKRNHTKTAREQQRHNQTVRPAILSPNVCSFDIIVVAVWFWVSLYFLFTSANFIHPISFIVFCCCSGLLREICRPLMLCHTSWCGWSNECKSFKWMDMWRWYMNIGAKCSCYKHTHLFQISHIQIIEPIFELDCLFELPRIHSHSTYA